MSEWGGNSNQDYQGADEEYLPKNKKMPWMQKLIGKERSDPQ